MLMRTDNHITSICNCSIYLIATWGEKGALDKEHNTKIINFIKSLGMKYNLNGLVPKHLALRSMVCCISNHRGHD